MSPNNSTNSRWITVVLITAIIMLIFVVFYGNKVPHAMPTPTPTPGSAQSETPSN